MYCEYFLKLKPVSKTWLCLDIIKLCEYTNLLKNNLYITVIIRFLYACPFRKWFISRSQKGLVHVCNRYASDFDLLLKWITFSFIHSRASFISLDSLREYEFLYLMSFVFPKFCYLQSLLCQQFYPYLVYLYAMSPNALFYQRISIVLDLFSRFYPTVKLPWFLASDWANNWSDRMYLVLLWFFMYI